MKELIFFISKRKILESTAHLLSSLARRTIRSFVTLYRNTDNHPCVRKDQIFINLHCSGYKTKTRDNNLKILIKEQLDPVVFGSQKRIALFYLLFLYRRERVDESIVGCHKSTMLISDLGSLKARAIVDSYTECKIWFQVVQWALYITRVTDHIKSTVDK